MTETLLNQAKTWGFVCNQDIQGNFQILPQKPIERWKLQQAEDKWVLVIGDVPQISLHPHEVISFLKRRRGSLN